MDVRRHPRSHSHPHHPPAWPPRNSVAGPYSVFVGSTRTSCALSASVVSDSAVFICDRHLQRHRCPCTPHSKRDCLIIPSATVAERVLSRRQPETHCQHQSAISATHRCQTSPPSTFASFIYIHQTSANLFRTFYLSSCRLQGLNLVKNHGTTIITARPSHRHLG